MRTESDKRTVYKTDCSDSISLKNAYKEGKEILAKAGITEADLDAWYLLEFVTGITKARYYMDPDQSMNPEAWKKYKEYLEKRLCSDQDDEIRQTTLDLVIEKEPLSKVHTRLSDMESEYDRLRDLVSLSLNVWKDALLSQRIKEIQEEIKLLCQASGDINRVEQLMQELSQLRAIRKQLIGDRVIIP